MADVDLIVNCYERTYRDVVKTGFFSSIEDQVGRSFSARYLLVNNVENSREVLEGAEALKKSGEITAFAFVADLLPSALAKTGVPARSLRRLGHLVDYGLAMTVLGHSPFLVGWDAEVRLESAVDWISPGLELLEGEPRVFSVGVDWPLRGMRESTAAIESFAKVDPYLLNYGFCDHLFLVRRSEVASMIFNKIAPVVWALRAEYPRTFEARIESYQRTSGRPRATDTRVRYTHNDLDHPAVRTRAIRGRHILTYRALVLARRVLLSSRGGPRWRAYPPPPGARRGAWCYSRSPQRKYGWSTAPCATHDQDD